MIVSEYAVVPVVIKRFPFACDTAIPAPVCITVPCVASTQDATSSAKLQAHASDSFHCIFIDVSVDSDVPVMTVDAISARVSSVAGFIKVQLAFSSCTLPSHSKYGKVCSIGF
jgi:hypothetical protein